MLDRGAKPNTKDKIQLLTPLHIACKLGHRKCVWLLLCAKADISAQDITGYTPLHVSVVAGHISVIELLLSAGADVNTLNAERRTSLAIASSVGHPEAVNLLIDAGADPNKLEAHGRNAMFLASSLDVIKVLLRRGASAKFIDIDGCSTLHHAGLLGRDGRLICALYQAGVDPTLRDLEGKTAADLAREKGHEDTAKMLDLLIAKHQASMA